MTNFGDVTRGQTKLIEEGAYGAEWNGNLNAPTKDAVYDKIEALPGTDDFVTLDDEQVLTNKLISGATNTFTVIPNSSLVNDSVTIGSTEVVLGATQATVAGLTLTSPILNTPNIRGWDGWINANTTWTYVSATTFVVATDLRSIFTKGLKLKFTQSTGGTKYFYVASSAYSAPNTTVTLVPTSDYTLNDEAIASPFYSLSNPSDFPKSHAFSPTQTGLSAISFSNFEYSINGGICLISFILGGTSNANTFTSDLPIAVGGIGFAPNFPIFVRDNGTDQSTLGVATISGSTLSFAKSYTTATTGWTTSNTKFAVGNNSYII